MTDAAPDLLFGLLALQTGLIDTSRLVAAFQAWSRDKGSSLADHFVAQGGLDPEGRAAIETLAAIRRKANGGDAARTLATIPTTSSAKEQLASIGDPGLDAALAHVRSGSTPARPEPPARPTRGGSRRRLTIATLAVVGLGLAVALAAQAWDNGRLKTSQEATRLALQETTRAKKDADAALARSETSRKQAEAARTFLVESFRGADPSLDGRQLKVVDLLDRASARAEADFARDPAMRGAVFDALGQTYLGLGMSDRAEASFAKALAAREAALGADHEQTLAARGHLAAAYQALGRGPEAIRLFEAVYRGLAGQFPNDDPKVMSAADDLGLAYYSAGRLHDAGVLLEETRLRREVRGAFDDPAVIQGRVNLGIVYLATRQLDESVGLLKWAVPQLEKLRGPEHPLTLVARGYLGEAYRAAGRAGEAVPLQEATLRVRERTLAPDHPDILTSRNDLAAAYLDSGRVADALPLFEDAIRGRESKLGPGHAQAIQSRLALASALEALGKERLEKGDRPDAESAFRRSLALRAADAPDDWPHFQSMSLLGATLAAQGRYAEAEPLAVSGAEGLEERDSMIPRAERTSRLHDAEKRVVSLYESWGRPEQAAPWKARLDLKRLPDNVFARSAPARRRPAAP